MNAIDQLILVVCAENDDLKSRLHIPAVQTQALVDTPRPECPMSADSVDACNSDYNPFPVCRSTLDDGETHKKNGNSISEIRRTPSKPCRSLTQRSLSTTTTRTKLQHKHGLTSQRLTRPTFPHLQPVDGGPANLQQMFSNFLSHHFPTLTAQDLLVRRRSYLLAIPTIDLSADALVRQAASVVCFAHIGFHEKDHRLIRESQLRYGNVLAMLSRDVNPDSSRRQPSSVILSILLMSLYDDAIPGPHTLQTNWIAHYQGAQAFLASAGPASIDMEKSIDSSLLINMREPALWIGLAVRKATVLSEKAWIDVAEQASSIPSGAAMLRRLALQIPGIVERAEKLLVDSTCKSQCMQLIDEIYTMKSTLQALFIDTRRQENLPDLEADLVHLTDHEAFDALIEEQLVMTINTTILSFFRLRSITVADNVARFYTFSLILDCTLLRLFHYQPDCSYQVNKDLRPQLYASSHKSAYNLCRTLHAFSVLTEDSLAMIAWMEIIVRLAENYFEQMSCTRERGWCQGVRLAIEMRKDRVMKTKPASLCRLDKLVEPISSLTRFCARPMVTAVL